MTTTPASSVAAPSTTELMGRVAAATRARLTERADAETIALTHHREDRWCDLDAQRAWIDMLTTATVAAAHDEVTVTATGPGATIHVGSLAEVLDTVVADVIAGAPLGEIDHPAPGVARYRHHAHVQVLAAGLRFCPMCAVIIANGDTSAEGAEQAAEAIAARWESRGHLLISADDDEPTPARQTYDCDGCGAGRDGEPITGALLCC